MSSASAAAAVTSETEISLVPGQYVVVPKSGLCVVTGTKTMDFGGVIEEVMEFRALRNPAASIMKPTKRLQTVGLRLPASAEEIEQILQSSFASVKGDGGGIWHHRAATYEEQINSAHPAALAISLNKMLSKYRSAKWKEDKIDPDLPKDGQISISYSERQLGIAALEHLGYELSHATGMSVPEARRTILRAALVQDYAGKIKLSDENAPGPVMDAETFKEVFGFAPGETPTGATIKIASIRQTGGTTYIRPEGQQGHRRVSNDAAPRFTGSAFSGKTVYDAGKHLQGDYLDLYKAEDKLVPVAGTPRLLFRHAPRTLDMGQFGIYSKLSLRDTEHKLTPEQVAQETGKPVNEVIAIRNRAASELLALFKRLGLPNVKHAAVRPYKERVANQKPAKAEPVVPLANRELYIAESDKISPNRIMKKVFVSSAQLLEPVEFRVFTQSQLRKNGARESFESLAASMDLPVEEIIAIRDRAAARLKQTGKFSMGRGTLKILEPYTAPAEKTPRPPREAKPGKKESLLQSIPEGNRSLFRAEEPNTAMKGSMRGLFLAAARSLNNWEFQIVTQTALRRGNRLTMQQAADAMELPLADAIQLRNEAMVKLIAASGQNPDSPRAPKFLGPYVHEEPKVRTPKPPKEKKVRQSVDRRALFLESIPEANRELFVAEEKFTPPKGQIKGLFTKAARALTLAEFRVISQTALRSPAHRLSPEQVAEQMQWSLQDVLNIRKSAAENLDQFMAAKSGRGSINLLGTKETKKTTFERAAKPSRTIGANQVDAYVGGDDVMVMIRLPKSALKGSGVKLDISWDAATGVPVIVGAQGRIKPAAKAPETGPAPQPE